DRFDPSLQKLPENIIEEIRFLTVIAKADATMQYRIIREKYKEDARMLLRRLHDRKIEDPRWVVLMKFNPATYSLTHLFWMSPEQQI
ncbi:6264_t:CDS:2, partial [Cetraspora pellucida]